MRKDLTKELKEAQAAIAELQDELNRSNHGVVVLTLELEAKANEIRKLNIELEERVTERTAQLEAANKELEAFSYSVSHDLRAPLRAIDGFGQALEEDCADQLSEEGQRLLGIIRENTRNMGKLIDDLLSFSRMGRQKMSSSELDMDTLVRSVFEELQELAPKHKLTIKIDPLPNACADRSMMHQVWINLLSNAIKFTRPREKPHIEIGGRVAERENEYYIKDNGVGFDMKYADKLFGVFQRLHGAAEFEGTGVGLALVQRVVNRHGGRVRAESEVGKGATFYFTLPKNEGGNQ